MPNTLTIRLSDDERAYLQCAADAEGMKLGAFVRQAAVAACFAEEKGSPDPPPTPAVRKPPDPSPPQKIEIQKAPRPKFTKGPRPTVGDLWGR